ncbi:hypothetical protein HU200_012261 [Digitaria exilis]|uniref:RNase H type-1 domain-containing protein n=1 Tax=Digitaria exilis TaxID=1010633 RepID=A0A835FFQ3_9POAL|nr:hypothetical protein HU200_012261 [Digitaria exilis]
MRKHWRLLEERLFSYTVPDWLQLLLDACSAKQVALTKLLLWRAWTVWNNITHQSGPSGIQESVYFLLAMQSSLWQIRQGSFVSHTGGAGLGVVIRNNNGDVMLTAWKVIMRCSYAVEAEAMACLVGLQLAAQHCQAPVILESDCARVVRTVRRERNLVADGLAHLARRTAHSVVWLGTAPACVQSLITNDCNSSD